MNRAKRIVEEARKRYSAGYISPYLYFKYVWLWESYSKDTGSSPRLSMMDEEEFDSRIESAIKEEFSYIRQQTEVKNHMAGDFERNQFLSISISELSEEFIDEMTAILRAYLYDRCAVDKKIAKRCSTFFRLFCHAKTGRDAIEEAFKKRLSSIPKPVICIANCFDGTFGKRDRCGNNEACRSSSPCSISKRIPNRRRKLDGSRPAKRWILLRWSKLQGTESRPVRSSF